MGLQGEKTRKLFERASKVIPFGVNSNFRYWGEQDTLVVTHGEGTYSGMRMESGISITGWVLGR